jgi:hypothetical protein
MDWMEFWKCAYVKEFGKRACARSPARQAPYFTVLLLYFLFIVIRYLFIIYFIYYLFICCLAGSCSGCRILIVSLFYLYSYCFIWIIYYNYVLLYCIVCCPLFFSFLLLFYLCVYVIFLSPCFPTSLYH